MRPPPLLPPLVASPGLAVYPSPRCHFDIAPRSAVSRDADRPTDVHLMSTVCPTGKDIEKACQGIYPLQNTYIRKVKVLRAPKFDVNKVSQLPLACCAVLCKGSVQCNACSYSCGQHEAGCRIWNA